MDKLRHKVFWPPFILLVLAVVLSLLVPEYFKLLMTGAKEWILNTFGWLFNIATLVMVVVCVWVLFSPLAKVRIGGREAEPMLTRWQWFAITLCTTIAVGILFWGTAEPIMHLTSPPKATGIAANSPEAMQFSMSTMFLHWSFTPYAIYTIPALMFALAFYNCGRQFSLGAPLFSLLNEERTNKIRPAIDMVSLYALVAGMAASLGAGILSLAGGINYMFGVEQGPLLYFGIGAAIVVVFLISAVSGLLKGIRLLSDWNMRVFIVLALFIFVAGPTMYIIKSAGAGIADYIVNFLPNSISTAGGLGSDWSKDWTMFYWANWMAWAPVAALFLGRIAYGYTVREFMLFNWIIPSLFAIVWMSIFSGTAINMELAGGNIASEMAAQGYQQAVYEVLKNLPFAQIVIPIFIATLFISFVTAADSNVAAMSGISSSGIDPQSPEPPNIVKIVWGILVGAVAVIMISYDNINGVRTLSDLGGLPALFLIIAITIALVKVLLKPSNYFKT